MENLRNRADFKIVRSNKNDKMRRMIASPLFARHEIFRNDLAGIEMYKSKLTLNKPVYVGMMILENSKILMYYFYYNELEKQCDQRCELLYTDTDSLLLEIHTEDTYKNMAEDNYLYDASDCPKDHLYVIQTQTKKSWAK